MKDNRLQEMQVFQAVAESRGFTAAAYELEVSQPFVSQTVSRLEKRLGVKLLHRTTRQLRLTPEGEQYLDSARTIMRALEEAETSFTTSSDQPAGDLRVSAPLSFGTDQLLPLLPRFLSDHPQIKVRLSLNDSIVNMIEDNFDVCVRMGRLQNSTLIAQKLCDLRRIVVAAPAYLDRHGHPSTPQDLRDHNCLEWHGPHEHLNRWRFRMKDGIWEHIADGNFRSSNGLSMAEMCFAGVGVMRMAEHLALPAIRRGALVRLLTEFEDDDMATAIHAVYLAERRVSPRLSHFIEFLVSSFRQPPWA